MSTQPNTTDLDRLEALAKDTQIGGSPMQAMRLMRDFQAAANPAVILELIALARRSSSSVSEVEMPTLIQALETGDDRESPRWFDIHASEVAMYTEEGYKVRMLYDRAATKAAAPADAPTGIPRESNDALIALARFWKLDGDWMTCKGCKRSLIASRDGEELNHASGCKFADQQHPWAQLRALIARRVSSAPAIPGTGREKEDAKPFGYWIVEGDDLPYPGAGFVRKLAEGRSYRSVTPLYAPPSHPSEANAGENQQ